MHDPCCTDVPSPCLEMSSLHRPTHHRRLMCPMSALMRSAAAGSIRADWSLQHCTGMEQACGEGANRGVHQGRVAVSTCHATELPVLEWPSAGQHQHTQTTQKTLKPASISPPAPCGLCIRSPWPYTAPGVGTSPFGRAESHPKVLVPNRRPVCLACWGCQSLVTRDVPVGVGWPPGWVD